MRIWAGVFLAVGLLGIGAAAAASSQSPVNRPSQPPKVAAPAAPAPVANPEQHYVPFANPCLVFHQTFPPNSAPQTEVISGTTGFEVQGGTAGGCGVPASASAVSINIYSTGATADGIFQVLGSGVSVVALAYLKGEKAAGSLNATLQTNGKIRVRTIGGGTQIWGRVNGYFQSAIVGFLNPDGTLFSATNRVLGSERIATGSVVVTIDRDPITCSISTNVAAGPYYTNGYRNNDGNLQVDTWSLDANAAPVPVDVYVNFAVHC